MSLDSDWAAPVETVAAAEPSSGRRDHARDGSTPAGGSDAVVSYLRNIADTPVLTRQQQYELAEAIDQERKAFLDAALAMPSTARALVRRWRDRKDHGYVTGVLSAKRATGRNEECSAEVDRAMARVERGLAGGAARRARPSARKPAPLAHGLRRAHLAFEVVVEGFQEADRELSGRRRAPSATERRHRDQARRALAAYEELRSTFVRHNLKLVIKFAKQYRGMGVAFPDLIQEGNLGLVRAVEKFEHRRGHKFSTYAAWWIHQAMIRAVQKHSRTVRAPSHVYDLQLRYKRVETELRARLHREPTRAEIAARLGLTAEEIDRVVSTMNPIVSTQAQIAGTDELTLDDALADESLPDPGDTLDSERVQREMHGLLEGLDARERTVIECRFGLGEEGEQTLQAIGERLGLSRERVRQIEARALARLRADGRVDRLVGALESRAQVA